jgi:hypothetical protein
MEEINALQITKFSLQELYDTRANVTGEMERDEETNYSDEEDPDQGNSSNTKRKFRPEKGERIELPRLKKGGDPTKSSSDSEFNYKHWKKRKQGEKDWKEHGHLPRPTVKKNYVGNSKEWKTSLIETSLRLNLGGYTAKLTDFSSMPEIRTLEDAIDLGFVLVKSDKL